MIVSINGKHVAIPVPLNEALYEMIRQTRDCSKSSFDKLQPAYDDLVALIAERKQEPVDLSCIE